MKLLAEADPLVSDAVLVRGREVVRIEREALGRLEECLGQSFVAACSLILNAARQIVITGMGKSGHVARKVAATFAATGTPAIYVHPSEAGHGDLGMLASGDVLLVLSNSGATPELRPMIQYARRTGIPVIGVASRKKSVVIDQAEVGIVLPDVREACSANIAPTASTAMQLALGDALAMTVMDMRGVSKNHLHKLHPAGNIGLSLTPVSDVMHGPDEMPLVDMRARMPEVISVMTSGRFGLAGVIDGTGALLGIITDGDLRRHFGVLTTACAHEVMTRAPKVIVGEIAAADALLFLNENVITAAFVVDDPAITPPRPIGIIHIHDLLRHGLS